ncbi:MAG: nucleotidyl transferase AbiEii/AbiGii toxin family protein [Planctomycetes bacterium]|nr:nucleotidyl transferase AbiEii/AbiGii toxin family protein [Planctomycetota bacterium]
MINRESVERVAKESGFRKDSVEKVMRLCRILRRLDSHPTTEGAWLLKGGTALNLLHLDVPRMSVDIDLNYVGAVGREDMAAARPEFEAALAAVCEREGCTVKRTPSEHAGGKFRLRFASVVGGSQNLEVDVSYVARVPLLGTERLTTRFPKDDPVEVTTLPLVELAAGKFSALVQRTVPRDAFDAANLLRKMPGLLENADFRLAFVCSMAGGRQDPRALEPKDPTPTPLTVRQQLIPMLQEGQESSALDPEAQCTRLQQELRGVAARLTNWSVPEREFLDRLHDEGEVDASLLHQDPEVQERIMTQPMLLWKAQNVRRHRKGAS